MASRALFKALTKQTTPQQNKQQTVQFQWHEFYLVTCHSGSEYRHLKEQINRNLAKLKMLLFSSRLIRFMYNSMI